MVVCETQVRSADVSALTWLLVGDIREMLQDHLDREAINWLQPVLDTLIDAIRAQCEREESAEWCGDVVGVFPHWSPHVDRMNAELRSLLDSLQALRHRIHAELPLIQTVAQIEIDLADWVAGMTEHSRRQRLLMQDVWYTELGGEG